MSGILRHLSRKKFDDGGRISLSDPYLRMSDPRTQIPQASPAPSGGGREYHPLANADYYTYGQTGGEHNFFTGNLPVAPLQPNNLPSGGGGGGATGADVSGASGVLAGLAGAAGAIKAGGQLADLYDKGKSLFTSSGDSGLDNMSGAYANKALEEAGFGGSSATPAAAAPEAKTGWNGISSGSLSNGMGMDDAGGVLGGLYSLTQKEGKFAGTASGAASGMSLAGWPGAIVGGALGYAQEGGIDDANPWDASGFSGLGMDAAWKDQNIARLSSNPAAALASKAGLKDDSIGMKLLDPGSWLSKHGDEKRNMKAFLGENAVQDLGGGKYKIGKATLNKDQLQDLAGAWYGAVYHPDGKQDYWKGLLGQKVNEYGLARGGAPTGVLSTYSRDPKFIGTVRGEGTGRSDEIPARLSDGEYVMDAETVALLGDGSTDAGARKLDEMRARLRSHKGKKLSKGKFSDNAKDPMEYIK